MKFPSQHGAWAFLIVPAVMAWFLGAGNWTGVLFIFAWVSGYPVSYFLGRALIARIRRGSWTNKAKIELRNLLPWLIFDGATSVALLILRPWLISYGILILLLWAVTVYLSWAGHERGIVNDLLLTSLASIAPILMYQVAKDHASLRGLPHSIWIAALMSLLFFVGSVIHVKALIREATNRDWHYGSLVFHATVFVLLVVFARSWYLIIPFALALVRTVVIKPGLRPGAIGVVELGASMALIACTVLANA